jgi:hypothetical protein
VDSENKDEGKNTSDDNSSPTYRYFRYNSLLHRNGSGGNEDGEDWSDEEDEEVASSTLARNTMDAKNAFAFYSSPKKKQGERARRTGGASPKARTVSHGGGTISPSSRAELVEMRKQRVMGWVREANAAAAATNAAEEGSGGLAMATEVERFKRLPKPFKPPPYQIKKELLQHKYDS